MKILKIILLVLLVAFVGIQFMPTERNQSDVVPQTDFMEVNHVPKDIQKQLQVSCYDCHSNNTKYPWYNTIQPIAWFLEHHINEGKGELNFNEWGSYSNRRKNSKLKSIISQIEDNKMPLKSYTFIHSNSIFTNTEKQEIIKYFNQLKDSLN